MGCCLHLVCSGYPQSHEKGAAFIWSTLQPDHALMQFDQPFGDGKSQTRPANLGCSLVRRLEELVEDLSLFLRHDPDSFVGHGKHHPLTVTKPSQNRQRKIVRFSLFYLHVDGFDSYLRFSLIEAELYSVIDKLGRHLLDALFVVV